MSRGPGRIERAIRALFAAHPGRAYVTDELVRHCYPGVTTERKHRVAVLRAVTNVIADDPDWQAWRLVYAQGSGRVFLNHANLQSYTEGRHLCVSYVSPQRAARKPHRRMTVGRSYALEVNEPRQPTERPALTANPQSWATPSSWEMEVKLHCAVRDGFTVLADALLDRLQAQSDASMP